MEQGYVDITLSQNITKLQLVYTKDPEPAQQPDNSQTETDSQQPSEEQEESSEEDGEQTNSQVMVAQLNSLSTIDVKLVDLNGQSIGEGTATINQGEISADSYGPIQGYQYDHAQTKDSGTYLDFVGELDGQYYYAMMSGDEGYYQPATPLNDGDSIQLVYKAVGSPIHLTKIGDGATVEGNEVDVPEYSSIDSGFNIQVTTARGYEAIVKVNDKILSSDTNVYVVSVAEATPNTETGKIEIEVEFNAIDTYQYWVDNMGLANWHGATWRNIGDESGKKDFDSGDEFTFTLEIEDEIDGGNIYFWRLDSFSINNEYVNVPTTYSQGAEASTTMSTGTKVKIKLESVKHVGGGFITKKRYKYTYSITIENAYEDIVITQGNFRENSWKEVMVQSIKGVDLEFYDKAPQEGSAQPNGWTSAKEAKPEGFDSQGDGSKIEFRYQVKAGYGNVVVATENGTNTNPTLESDGYYHFFVNEDKTEGLTILRVEATPINFSVKYISGSQEAENLPSDNNTYSISGAVNTESSIFVNNKIPTANGYVFNGWKIAGSKSYWPGDSIDLVDVAEQANENNELVFVAQWVPEDQAPERITYNVNVYIEDEGKRELIDQETKTAEYGQRITILNLPSDKEELKEQLQGYILDRDASKLSIVVDKTDLSIDFVYKKAEYTITTDVVNGTINPEHSIVVKYGEDQKVTFKADKGYKLGKILVDGEEVEYDNDTTEYIFKDVSKNHSIKVEYIKDEAATKTLSYKVEYYLDGKHQKDHDNTVQKKVWVNDPNTLQVEDESINTTNEFGEGYVLDYTEPADIPDTVNNGDVIKVYYATSADEDDIPDKYQVTVTYKVKNGSWDDETTNDKTERVTLKKDGKLSEDGTATLSDVPNVGLKPAKGYKAGSWSTEMDKVVISKDSAKEFTYTYLRDLSTISVTPYEGTYDGKGHNVTVKGTINGDKVEYSTDGEKYSDNLSFVDVTNNEQKVYVRVTNGDQSTVVESYVLITPAPVTVKSGSAKKVYDGTPLTNTKDTSISGLVNGEKVTLTTDGTITDVGSVSNTVTIDWGSVKETNYTVTYKFGTLTVTAQSIDPSDPSYLNVKVSKPENKVYDGKDHKWIPEVTLEDGTPLVEGTDYTVTYSTENFKDVQKIKVTISGTGNYNGTVTRTYRITRKSITVTTDSAIKVYDGTALTADGRVEGIVDGETYGFVITGKQIEVGASENTYKIEWTGSAKEGNYKITEDLGTLTVVPQSIDPEDPTEPEDPDQPVYAGITVDKPEDKVYDGQEHKWTPTVTLSDGTVLDPENYEVSYDTEDFVNVTGKITVTITGTGNYAGTVTRTYQITPRAVTITSADDSKVYDGTPLTNGNVSVTEGSLVSEEDITFKAMGSQTEVGSSANTIEVTYANEQMEKNYKVTLDEGTLTVTEKPAGSDSDEDSESTDGEDTATSTNVGIFASLATSALAGLGILTALKKRRKN